MPGKGATSSYTYISLLSPHLPYIFHEYSPSFSLLTILFHSCTNLFLSLDFNFPNTYPLETNSNSFSFSLLLPPPSFDQLTFRRTCSPAANETARFLISRAEQLMRIRNCEVNLAVAVFAATKSILGDHSSSRRM